MRYGTFCTGIGAPEVHQDGRRNNAKASEMYAVYLSGKSLAHVAAQFGCTRQSVYGAFTTRGWQCRPRTFLPFIEYEGEKYTVNSQGYYRCTVGRTRTKFLHIEVWKKNNGTIPAGYDVHHKDDDKQNNDPSNLECLPKPEHTRLYSPHNNQYTRGQKRREFPVKHCAYCGASLIPHRHKRVKESPSAFKARKTCGVACGRAALRGKRRGEAA